MPYVRSGRLNLTRTYFQKKGHRECVKIIVFSYSSVARLYHLLSWSRLGESSAMQFTFHLGRAKGHYKLVQLNRAELKLSPYITIDGLDF